MTNGTFPIRCMFQTFWSTARVSTISRYMATRSSPDRPSSVCLTVSPLVWRLAVSFMAGLTIIVQHNELLGPEHRYLVPAYPALALLSAIQLERIRKIPRVRWLIRKQDLKNNPEAQLLEDVICLVFLENYFADFARDHDAEKLVRILRKTWKKMSPRGEQKDREGKARENLAKLFRK